MTNHDSREPHVDSKVDIANEPTVIHAESSQGQEKWDAVNSKDRDVALALFDNPEELHEEIDPAEARRILWKIDFMILPYLAVCYAFFYIDKVGLKPIVSPAFSSSRDQFFLLQTTLSYAAIFGIKDDLNLHGTQYSWLSSIFYFGFLVWAFPTNFLMQRLPIGNSLLKDIPHIVQSHLI